MHPQTYPHLNTLNSKYVLLFDKRDSEDDVKVKDPEIVRFSWLAQYISCESVKYDTFFWWSQRELQ